MSELYNYLRVVSKTNGMKTKKDSQIRLLKHNITNDFKKTIDAEDTFVNGNPQMVLITRDKGDEQIKKVRSLPNERLDLGDIVTWNGIDYIIYKMDADRRIQSKGRMYECNTVLRWMNSYGEVVERPGKGEDATKYSEGTQGGHTIRIGEFQLKVIIRLDAESVLIRRDDRFMIDATAFMDVLANNDVIPMVYRVTRRNVVTGTFQDRGYVEITLVEDQFIAGHDDIENRLACRKREIIESGAEGCENVFSTSNEEEDWL